MKVCIIVPETFPVPAVRGGAVESLVEIIVEENETNNDIMIDLISSYDELAKKLSSSFKNTKFIYIEANKKLDKFFGLLHRLIRKTVGVFTFKNVYYYKVYKHLLREEYDLIVVEGGDLLAYSQIIRKIGSKSFIAHLHGDVFGRKSLNGNRISRLYDNFISVSDYVSNNAIFNAGIKQNTIYKLNNCIDNRNFIYSSNQKQTLRNKLDHLNISSEDFVVLFCGRIVPEKGLRELINAIINIDISNIKLLIVGSVNFGDEKVSTYQKEIQNKVESMPHRIITTGYIENQYISKYYAISDLIVIPTLVEEAAGLVAIEAMTMGLPLIVTKSGGLVEYVDQDCSIMIEKDNDVQKSIEISIKTLYKDRQRLSTMGKCALKRSQMYNREKFYNNFVKILNEINNKDKEDNNE